MSTEGTPFDELIASGKMDGYGRPLDEVVMTDAPLHPGTVAQIRLQECHRLLADVAMSDRPIAGGLAMRARSLLEAHGVEGFGG